MDWLAYDTDNCSVQRTIEVIGDRWSGIVLREIFNGVRRFDQIKEHTGVSDSVLSDRLRKLVAHGILVSREYQEPGSRRRKEYRLTDAGLDLQPIFVSMLRWGDAHRPSADGPAIEIHHRGCGAPVRAAVVCDEGHVVQQRDVRASPGPGARLR
ncbi:winged helix-turn-helix transcriptional regulator [Gordonia hydrophobica]|uniref:Helix-turn-helix domain-containing protein n=1 Tax=Gordonia hydrophobica TaxID=40516 RepID=A0ABZ2U4Z4_9ACTN|nr:helix-turn-helix domain-containing protein [Gordonia hydrophobica]MBM7368267.1 DNA-binding HxlR family transcriptional regulator [Gordonia hydrophobica]